MVKLSTKKYVLVRKREIVVDRTEPPNSYGVETR